MGRQRREKAFSDPFSHLVQTKNQQPHFCKLLIFRAENGTRTRDLNLGKVALYQLSYFRNLLPMTPFGAFCVGKDKSKFLFCKIFQQKKSLIAGLRNQPQTPRTNRRGRY